MYSVEDVAQRVNRMWALLARSAERRAHQEMKAGNYVRAKTMAQHAEAFYWQSTGENDCFDLHNIKL